MIIVVETCEAVKERYIRKNESSNSMDNLGKYFQRTLVILFLLFVSCSKCSRRYQAIQTRQNSLCANHAMGEFVANPQDCHLFYWCGENGQAVSAACPLRMLFNPQTRLCDTRENVQCSQLTPISTPATTARPLAPSPFSTIQEYCVSSYEQHPNSDSLIFLAHPSRCNQYYMCYYGQALLQACSTDLQWNSRIGKCDFPENTNCETQVNKVLLPMVPTETVSAGSNAIVCPVYGQHIFPHMQLCNKFIYCVKGHAIIQQCPFYQDFDVESSRCISRKKALCVKNLKLEYKRNTF